MKTDILIMGACFIVGLCTGMNIIITFSVPKWQAIQHGAAHYDAKTAEFTWNDEVNK